MVQILELLDSEVKSENAIFLFEIATGKVEGGNLQANALFAKKPDEFDMLKILSPVDSIEGLLAEACEGLKATPHCIIYNKELFTVSEETVLCNMDFTYATDSMDRMLLIIRVKEDKRPEYLKMLLKKSKRPTFLIDFGQNMVVRDANDVFYHSFACSADTIEAKYQSHFENFLGEENREEYILNISVALNQQEKGIVEVPLQTARGEVMYFYFSKVRITQFLPEGDTCIFCQLVNQKETLEDVEYPFDVADFEVEI